MRLAGMTALITGAADGIGYAVAELFAKQGATVFASDRAEPMTGHAEGIVPLTLDVTREEDWERAVDTVVEQTGRLDVLINNAGIVTHEPLDATGLEDWLRVIALDQTGVFLGMREAVGVMRRQKAGSIVNVSSIWDVAAAAGAHAYQAAMGAVRNMSRNAAIRYGAEGIRVNFVNLGFIHTLLADAQERGLNEAVIDATPMKRGGLPIEVAYGCLFFASSESSFVTGAELVIDGGYLAR